MKGCRHMSGFHPREGVSIQRKTVGTDIGRTQARAGRQHDDRSLLATAHLGCFSNAAVVSVIASHQRNRAPGAFGERLRVVGVKIPPRKRGGQVRGAVQNAITLIRSGNCQSNSADLIPQQTIGVEKFVDSLNPTFNHRGGSKLGIGRALGKLERNRSFVREDATCLRSRRAAIGAEVNFFHSTGIRSRQLKQ